METPIINQTPVKNSSSKLLILLILLVIILAIVVGVMVGYLLGSSKNQPVVSTPVVSPPSVISSPVPTSTPDPTANWKTYTNTEGKYSIGYPTDFRVITPPIGATAINIVNTDNTFHLIIDSEPTSLDLFKYIDQKTWCTSINSTTGKPFEIDRENFLRFEKTPCGQTGSTDLYAIHNGIAYHLSMGTQQNYDTLLPELNQILSTFKFLQ